MQMRLQSERGAIIIHVALALVALLAFSTFVVDHGMLFVARGQAQNAADAGALAGAISLLYNPTEGTGAEQAARHFAANNAIWGEGTAQAHIVVPTPPIACPDGIAACVRVDVMRGQPDRANQPHANTFHTVFGYIVGINQQGTRATATAQVGRGNAVKCIKPWIVADKWIDNSGTGLNTTGWDQMDLYNPGDTYTPPQLKATGPGNDYGLQLVLKEGETGTYSSGWTRQLEWPGCPGVSSACYREEIEGCPSWVPEVGLYDGSIPCSNKSDTSDPSRGCVDVKPGMATGPTSQGVRALIEPDSTATWNTTTNSIQGGCMADGSCNLSPRVVPIAIMNTGAYVAMAEANDCNGSTCVAQVVNLLGFFIEGFCDEVYPDAGSRPLYCGTPSEARRNLVGRLMNYPGQYSGVAGSAGPSSFIKVVRLIR